MEIILPDHEDSKYFKSAFLLAMDAVNELSELVDISGDQEAQDEASRIVDDLIMFLTISNFEDTPPEQRN